MSEIRPASHAPAGDGHHEAIPEDVAHLYADLDIKCSEPSTLDACRTDYVLGAAERAAFDARARRMTNDQDQP
ncbi:hypothetical protein [Streptomyces sp. NPDC005970]|uniref:hypothetical protein n=1 Tax=Streptomyces sp. NPDC005970 TaxID=3156723 RepID=UPI0033C24D74